MLSYFCIVEINYIDLKLVYIEFCVFYDFIIDNFLLVYISKSSYFLVQFLFDIGINVIFIL